MGSSISVQITGFVGSDVVLKEVGEQRVASFSLAVNRTVRRHNGSTSTGKQQTLWVRVNAWNGLQNGEPRVSLDLDANRIILLDRVGTNELETEQIPF